MGEAFKVGDLVFAKVRGYPSWPARVKNAAIDTVNAKNTRFEVFFFGTYETAQCRSEEICYYEANKEKLGKQQKRKNFKEALWEIENTPDTLGPPAMPMPSGPEIPKDVAMDDDTRSETSTHSSKGIKRASMIKKQRESFDAADDDTPARKKPKKSEMVVETPEQMKFSPTSGAAPEPERVSRSGRKIKPKRFLDEEVGQEEEVRDRKSLSDEIPKKMVKPIDESKKVATVAPNEPDKSAKRSGRISSTEAKKSPMPKLIVKPLSKGKDSEDFIPPTATVSPIVANTASKKIMQDKKMKVTFTQQQAQKMLDNEKTPDVVKDMLSKEIQAKLEEKEENMKTKKAEKRKSKLLFLKIEVRLLQIDTVIKAKLSLDKAETKPVLQVLDELKNLKLSPIMLKKHPDIVFTIKKLKKYVGNVKSWNQTEEEKEEFAKKAGEIRQRASQIFEYFKLVLLGTKDATDVSNKFLKQINELKEKTKDLTPTKFAALTKDPCANVTPPAKPKESEEPSKKDSSESEEQSSEVPQPPAENKSSIEEKKDETEASSANE